MFAQIIHTPMFLYGTVGIVATMVLLLVLCLVLIVRNAHKKLLLQSYQQQLNDLNTRNLQLIEVNSGLTAENTRLTTEIKNLHRYTEEKIAYIEQSKNEMALKFRDISGEILRQQSQQMNTNQTNMLTALLNPFKEQLQSFKDEVQRANTENIKNKSSFDEQFKNLLNLNQALSQDAQNLTNALRGSKKMQGDWGEIELYRLLEVAGLQKDIDYYTQENFKTDERQNMRPDVVVKLPNKRSVIIDSKVSMNDYVSYINAEDETQKITALQKHIQCIKNHIDIRVQ